MRWYQGCIVDDSKDCAVGVFTLSHSEHDTSADGFSTTPLSKFRFRERHYEFGGRRRFGRRQARGPEKNSHRRRKNFITGESRRTGAFAARRQSGARIART
jgi:hypothetical protein